MGADAYRTREPGLGQALRPFLPGPTLSIPEKRNRDARKLKRTPESPVSGRSGPGTRLPTRLPTRRPPPMTRAGPVVHLPASSPPSPSTWASDCPPAWRGPPGPRGSVWSHAGGQSRGAAGRPAESTQAAPSEGCSVQVTDSAGPATQTQRAPGRARGGRRRVQSDQDTLPRIERERGLEKKCHTTPLPGVCVLKSTVFFL